MTPKPRARAALLAGAAFVLGACFGPDPNLTSTGKGRPVVTVAFPAEIEAGSTNALEITVANPGPGDMRSFVIAFAFVGPGGGGEPLPPPLIPIGTERSNPAIASVEPEPGAVSDDGVLYVFGALAEGESRTVTFQVVAPDSRGSAANSVTVYDGEDPERAAGARLEARVT